MLTNKLHSSVKMLGLIFLATMHLGCKAQATESYEKALKIISVFPIQDSEESMLRSTHTFKLVERDSISIFIIPFFQYSMRTNIDKYGDYISDEWIKTDTTEYYVIYKQNQKYGYTYDTMINNSWRPIDVDSFLNSSTVLSLEGSVSGFKANDSLILSTTDKSGSILTETYVPKIKKDFTYSDTMIIRYDRSLNDFRFSFSKEEDKQKQKKLCQIKMIYNPDPQAANPELRPGRIISFEMSGIKMSKSAYIDTLVHTFENLSKLNH